jgi:hypothetical protein
MRVAWLALAVVMALCGCRGGHSSSVGSNAVKPSDRSSTDLFELDAEFEGQGAKVLGSSREWYAPATDLYRVEHRVERPGGVQRIVDVYDGSTITRRTSDGLFRIEGERAMLRDVASRPIVFVAPAIVAVRSYLHRQHLPSFVVEPRDGGRAFDVDWHYVDEGVDTHFRYRVQVRSRLSEHEARARGVLRPPTGNLVGIFKQSPPGSRPHFGERAYWFGDRIGQAKAITVLEQRGGDPFNIDASYSRPAEYTTLYRFPRPAGLALPARYPGLGETLSIDVRVQCQPKEKGFLPGVLPGTRGSPLRLEDGTPATLYVTEYEQGTRRGVTADIVVGTTVCFVSGLISPDEFRRLAPTLRPLG